MTTMTLPDTAAAHRALVAATDDLARARALQRTLDQQWRTAVLAALETGTGPRALAPLAGISHGRVSQLRTESRTTPVSSSDADVLGSAGNVSDGQHRSASAAGGRVEASPDTRTSEQVLAEVRRTTALRRHAIEQVTTAEAHRDEMIRAASRALVPQKDLMRVADLSRDRIFRILRAAPATSAH